MDTLRSRKQSIWYFSWLFAGVSGVCVVLLLIWAALDNRRVGPLPYPASPKQIPNVLSAEDYQIGSDREVLNRLETLENSAVSSWIDTALLKPFIDDVCTAKLNLSAVEITAEQFPERPELNKIVEDCARILHLDKIPRVFVRNDPVPNAFTTNVADPVIVLNSGIIQLCETGDEIRFVIGHEMAHVACHHVKWMSVARLLVQSLGGDHSAIAGLSIFPLLKWCRDAEITADRAALICVQDLDDCEQALARLALGLPRSLIGRISVDAYLTQNTVWETSTFADVTLFINQLATTHPFPCSRIQKIREFYHSEEYKHIFMPSRQG